MTESTDQTPSRSQRHAFGLRHLLIAVAAVAVPMATFTRYWAKVNDTVDERTIPFRDTAFQNQLLLYVAAAILALIAIGLIAWFLSRRSYLGGAGLLLAYLLCFPFLASLTQSRIIDPEQGNPEAEVHNDAAAIAAAAVDRFYARTHRWPRNWSELGDDIADVIGEVQQKHNEPKADPFSAAANPFSGDASKIEESQSILGRAPDLRDLTPYELRNLVDINFDADPAELARMNWVEFDGIVPHKPAYNMYRVEFGKLIARLNETPNTSGGSAETAK